MYENLSADVQEIKRCLSLCEQKNIDENTLYELINSFGPDYKLRSIIELIMGTDHNYESNLVEAGSFDTSCETLKDEIVDEEMDVEELYSNESCTDTSLNNSDNGIDNNSDIFNIHSNDGLKKTSIKQSIPQSSHLLSNVEVHGNTITSISHDSACTIIDIEILEDSNDDINDNVQSIQNLPKQADLTSIAEDNSSETDSINCLSTLAHSSSDIGNTSFPSFDKTINEEAFKICDLIPNFNYELVYKILYKNRKLKNRIELSLWDLLPFKRPMKLYADDFSRQQLTVSDTTLNHTSNSQFTWDDNKNPTGELQMNDKNEFLAHSVENDKVSSTARGGVLRPAKLLINNKSQKQQTISGSSITLSPPKLINLTAKQLNERFKEISSKSQQYKCKMRSLSESKSTKLARYNNPKGHILSKYMQYLKYMQTIKQQKLNNECDHFNFDKRNNIRKVFLESHCSNPTLNILDDINTKETSKDVCDINVNSTTNIFDPIEGSPENCTDSLVNDNLNDAATINLQSLSNISSTHTSVVSANSTAISSNNLFSQSTLNSAVTNSNIATCQTISETTYNVPSYTTAQDCKPSTSTKIHSAFGGARRKTIDEKKCSTGNKDTKEGSVALPLKLQPMYEALESMFPGINKNFIRETCKNLSKLEDICSIKELQELAEHTLLNKDMGSIGIDIASQCQGYENNLYDYLSGIFPNADATYLRKVIARARDTPSEITNFIQTQWEQPTYPTKEEKLQKLKITKQQMQYTKRFDLKQFLEIFPDPFTHFKNPERNCKYNSDAFEFLKFHFSHFEEFSLKHVYSLNNYNLTLTVQKLEKLPPYKKLAETTYLWEKCPPEDIPLLQEYAFLKHREEIMKYMVKLKETEIKEFEKLKKNKELLECQCCYDTECMPSKCSTCDDGHIFCNSCILKGIESQLAQGETRISCFSLCDGEFSVPTLQKILPPTVFSIFIRKKQEAEVMAAGIEGLVSCPFCHFASIPPAEDRVFKCLNPDCMKESCRLCKELNHVPLKCYEEKSEKARLLLEEKMTEALVRKCYKCKRPYYKIDGCNKITCACGAVMCYICDIPIHNYSHFGAGGCPTWSDNIRINTDTVRAVAMKTMEFIKKEDPNVQINSDNLLKNLPATSNSAITARVNKVVKFDT